MARRTLCLLVFVIVSAISIEARACPPGRSWKVFVYEKAAYPGKHSELGTTVFDRSGTRCSVSNVFVSNPPPGKLKRYEEVYTECKYSNGNVAKTTSFSAHGLDGNVVFRAAGLEIEDVDNGVQVTVSLSCDEVMPTKEKAKSAEEESRITNQSSARGDGGAD